MSRLALPTLLLALTWSGPVMAAPYRVTFCARYDLSNFFDAPVALSADYLGSTWVAAIGARIRVINNDTGAIVFEDYASLGGCTPELFLYSFHDYSVYLYSESAVNDNFVEVRSSAGLLFAHAQWSGLAPFVPSTSGTYTFTIPAQDQWNVAGVASFALSRHNAGLSDQTIDLRLMGAPSGAGSGVSEGVPYIYILPNSLKGAKGRVAIAHEMGHFMLRLRDENTHPNRDYDAEGDSTHSLIEREYQSAAAWEGFAHFYAAATYNSSAEEDCVFLYYGNVDWNMDGYFESSAPFAVSCEGAPLPGYTPSNFLENEYTGIMANRGIEYDYLRMLWDLHTNEGFSSEQIFDIWDTANPRTWTASGDSSASSSSPRNRLQAAASSLSAAHGAAWATWSAEHGVDN